MLATAPTARPAAAPTTRRSASSCRPACSKPSMPRFSDRDTWLDTNADTPVELNYGIPREPRTVLTNVDTYNLTAGLEGIDPGQRLDLGSVRQRGVNRSPSPARPACFSLDPRPHLLRAPGFGLGLCNNSNTASIRQNVVNGVPTASARTSPLAPPASTSSPAWDAISPDCKEAMKADLKNRETMQPDDLGGERQGSLLDFRQARSRRPSVQLSQGEVRVHQRYDHDPGRFVPRPVDRHLPERRLPDGLSTSRKSTANCDSDPQGHLHQGVQPRTRRRVSRDYNTTGAS